MFKQVASKAVVVASAVAILAGCNKGTTSYSLLSDSNDFKQQAVYAPKKIDILWVIDNSGSMATSQNNLAANFQSFINRFQQSNYDFHMSVVTTDGWEKRFKSSSKKARIRDGETTYNSQDNPTVYTSSGVFVMDKNTPNLSDIFSTNIKQGVRGNGDERALDSFLQALNDPWNADFRRPDAFLAVIIVSDEEDFSATSSSFNESYSNSKLLPVQHFADFLTTHVGSKNYSVNTIYVPDTACRNSLSTDGFQRKISTRLPELSDLTGGVKASLCGNFADSLTLISDSIIELSAVFKLGREPKPETIVVTVDGQVIPEDSSNGWVYDPVEWTITFKGSAVPGADSTISIDYDPMSIKL